MTPITSSTSADSAQGGTSRHLRWNRFPALTTISVSPGETGTFIWRLATSHPRGRAPPLREFLCGLLGKNNASNVWHEMVNHLDSCPFYQEESRRAIIMHAYMTGSFHRYCVPSFPPLSNIQAAVHFTTIRSILCRMFHILVKWTTCSLLKTKEARRLNLRHIHMKRQEEMPGDSEGLFFVTRTTSKL
ncbi:hypothetical protein AVEN_106117-1 [Araneus ventricosus]|uniref:Uncharacterized protein n=1 Tax=Araneus ventricosus TaxID=182803 RepID=A0A4Y2RP20_ARAVE|nr:hypothetical protein AVEN_106117-1 [Araneus ventricosus]